MSSTHLSPEPPAPGPEPSAVPLARAGSRAALERAVARWSTLFGSASTAALEARARATLCDFEAAALALTPGTPGCEVNVAAIEQLLGRLERDHEAHHGRSALSAERADDRARERAGRSGPELVRYQAAWEGKLARLQRAHPQRWRVPGLSDEEVRAAITLRLIELIVSPGADELPRGRPGKPWGLCVAQAEIVALRRSFRLAATPTDFARTPASERAPSQEERWLELEADQLRTLATERARRQLNRPQRDWLAAMQHAATEGAFFASSDQLNLSAASRALGKNRSSAQRAFRALEECFQRELARIE